MKMPINTSGVALAAVAAMLFNVVPVSTAGATEAKVQCEGVNACKGQSACKTACGSAYNDAGNCWTNSIPPPWCQAKATVCRRRYRSYEGSHRRADRARRQR